MFAIVSIQASLVSGPLGKHALTLAYHLKLCFDQVRIR